MEKLKDDCFLIKNKKERNMCHKLLKKAHNEEDLKKADNILNYLRSLNLKPEISKKCNEMFRKGNGDVEFGVSLYHDIDYDKLSRMLPTGPINHNDIAFDTREIGKEIINIRSGDVVIRCSQLHRF
jgi:hypothetical protein